MKTTSTVLICHKMTLHTGAAEDDNSNFLKQGLEFNLQNGFQTCSEKAPFSVAEVIKDEVKIKEHNTSNI